MGVGLRAYELYALPSGVAFAVRCSAESMPAAVTVLNMSGLVPPMNAEDTFETSYVYERPPES